MATVARTMQAPDGTTTSDTVTVADTSVTADTIRQRAVAAITANVNYLAIATPTNAQVSAQVQALTKECSSLIRLLLDQLDSTAGS